MGSLTNTISTISANQKNNNKIVAYIIDIVKILKSSSVFYICDPALVKISKNGHAFLVCGTRFE